MVGCSSAVQMQNNSSNQYTLDDSWTGGLSTVVPHQYIHKQTEWALRSDAQETVPNAQWISHRGWHLVTRKCSCRGTYVCTHTSVYVCMYILYVLAETEMVLTRFHKANALICVRMYLTLLCRDISNVYPQFMYAIWHVSHVENGCFQYVSTAKEWSPSQCWIGWRHKYVRTYVCKVADGTSGYVRKKECHTPGGRQICICKPQVLITDAFDFVSEHHTKAFQLCCAVLYAGTYVGREVLASALTPS